MSFFDFVSAIFTPMTNVDGTPMIQSSGLDLNGNPFGMTNDSHTMDTLSAFDSFGSSSIFDN
jgi:hypothetical protein